MADQKPQEQPWPYDWMPPFLLALRNSANVRASCQAAGISRKEAYKRRATSARFREAWDEALEDAIDTLEGTAWKMARDGNAFILWRLLASLRREKYSDRVEVAVNIRQQAEALAEKYGLDAREIIAEAENIVAGAQRG